MDSSCFSSKEITIEEPEVMKHGSKYGIKIKANALQFIIRAEIMTE